MCVGVEVEGRGACVFVSVWRGWGRVCLFVSLGGGGHVCLFLCGGVGACVFVCVEGSFLSMCLWVQGCVVMCVEGECLRVG